MASENATPGPGEPGDGRPPRGASSRRVDRNARERARTTAPWFASVALHLGLIALGFAVTWSVAVLIQDREPTRIVADFYDMAYEPVAVVDAAPSPADDRVVRDRLTFELPEPAPAEAAVELEFDPVDRGSAPASTSAFATFAPAPVRARASFVGVSSSNARRVVYVIDASGSMIASLPVVIHELGRSLTALTEEQEFAVIFFQRNDAVTVPPADRLTPATPAHIVAALKWIDANVIATGRSNPLAALGKAVALRPDVIFVLSQNITGSGQFEIPQDDLLARLDRLNPADAKGRRRTQINCIQFLDPDPLDTLRIIAERHGGPKGYKFLDREELGLGAK